MHLMVKFSADGIESTSDLCFELGRPFAVDVDSGLDGLGLCNQVKIVASIR